MIANSVFANPVRMEKESADKEFIQRLVEHVGASPSEVATRAGLAVSTLTRPLNHPVTHKLSKSTIDKLLATYPTFLDFMKGPHTAANSDDVHDVEIDYVSVRVIPSFGGAGGIGDGNHLVAKMPRHLIEEELRGEAKNFELIDIRGDSMEPKFLQGDQLLIDLRDRDPGQPGSFVVQDDDGYVVKLVERIAGKRGWLRIFSVNGLYSPYEIEETKATIRGRPVWFARRL